MTASVRPDGAGMKRWLQEPQRVQKTNRPRLPSFDVFTLDVLKFDVFDVLRYGVFDASRLHFLVLVFDVSLYFDVSTRNEGRFDLLTFDFLTLDVRRLT